MITHQITGIFEIINDEYSYSALESCTVFPYIIVLYLLSYS